jgi:hypothetical protein
MRFTTTGKTIPAPQRSPISPASSVIRGTHSHQGHDVVHEHGLEGIPHPWVYRQPGTPGLGQLEGKLLLPITLVAIGLGIPSIPASSGDAMKRKSPAGYRHCSHSHRGNSLQRAAAWPGHRCSSESCGSSSKRRFHSVDGEAFSSSQLTTASTSASLRP